MTLDSHSRVARGRWRWRLTVAGIAALCLATGLAVTSPGSGAAPTDGSASFARSLTERQKRTTETALSAPAPASEVRDVWAGTPRARLRYSLTLGRPDDPSEERTQAENAGTESGLDAPLLHAKTLTVREGDSLYTLFEANRLEHRDLVAVMAAGKGTRALSLLRPGDRIVVYTDPGDRFQGLRLERGGKTRLDVARHIDGRFDGDGETFRTGIEIPDSSVVALDIADDDGNDWVELHKPPPRLERRSVDVANGDSLYAIFKRNGFRLADLEAIVRADEDTRELSRLSPGQRIEFHLTADMGVSKLVHYLDETRTLHVRRNGVGYHSELVDVPLDRHVATAEGVIESSLFLAGQRAGLSNNVIMQLVEIFGWDVDFALDIRTGDRFAVIYEELYKDGNKLRDGKILAASFTNQGKTTRIVRYDYEDGRSAYFKPDGVSIRKAFLRTPVNYTRITSRFSLRRKHPVLHKFRAHRGVDYAAPRGTPIKATGDGKIEYIGNKGGYGKTIVLRHGATYTTLYAHMSRFARGMRRGKSVSQGQIIGYIGSTGLSTGPHLHYEFRVRGVHRNPLSVKLPKAAPIEAQHRDHFIATTRDMVARLDFMTKSTLAADERRLTDTD